MVVLLAGGVAVAPKVEPVGALADATAPAALRSLLEAKGAKLSMDGGPFCELWLREKVPSEKGASAGTLLPDLPVSTLVGAIRFSAAAADFRGQAIAPGLYTLRFGMPPADGSHLGVSDFPDFLLVLRAVDDPDPKARMKFEDLLDASRKATGTKHPGVFNLTRPSGAAFPETFTDDKGHVVLQTKGKLDTGADLSIALIVKGHAEQ